MTNSLAATFALATLLGCESSGPADSPTDSGAGYAGDPPVVEWITEGTPPVAPPQIDWLDAGLDVAPPEFTCLAGWTPTLLDNGATVCDPWPATGREVCTSETAIHVPGTPGCVEVGATCSGSGWPEGLPASGVWYVAPGATGDGTAPDAALPSIALALAAAAPGDTIALAAGSYDEALTITGEVTILGACAAETSVTASALDETGAVFSVEGGNLTLADVRVVDSPGMGVHSTAGATVALDGVVLLRNTARNAQFEDSTTTITGSRFAEARVSPTDGLRGYGISVFNGTLDLEGSVLDMNSSAGLINDSAIVTVSGSLVADTRYREVDGLAGYGTAAWGSANFTVSGLVVEGGYSVGVLCTDEANCFLSDSVVRGVNNNGDLSLGSGVRAEAPASLRAERVYSVGSAGAGVYVRGDKESPSSPTHLTLTDVVVVGGPPHTYGGSYGYGVVAIYASEVTATRVVSTDTQGDAFWFEDGVVADLTDVRAERSGLAAVYGVGIGLNQAEVTVTRAWLADNASGGVHAYGEGGASLTLTDVFVSNAGAAVPGPGVWAGGLDALTATRLVVQDSGTEGLAADKCATVTLGDVVVRRTQPGSDLTGGVGIQLTGKAKTVAQLTRLSVSDSVLAGVWLNVPATVEDLAVSETTSGGMYQDLGIGVYLDEGSVTGARWSVAGSQDAGVVLVDSTLTLSEAVVSRVTPRACATTSCQTETAATGAYIDETSTLALTSFLVSDTEGVGVQSAGTTTLTDGYVRAAPYGTEALGQGTVGLTRVDTTEAAAQNPTEAQPAPSLDLP